MAEAAGKGSGESGPGLKDWRAQAAVLAVGLSVLLGVDPISRADSHLGRLVLAAVGGLLLHLQWRRRQLDADFELWSASQRPGAAGRAARWLLLGWVLACCTALGNYYQFDRRTLTTLGDYSDATYYYLNSKYFEELGYTELYRAMLVADHEGGQHLGDVVRFRDLVAYEQILPKRAALDAADEIKARFSDARWRAFEHDVAFLVSRRISGNWRYFFIDHGYNPPPTWTLVGGALARITPVEKLKRITSIDMVLVAAMMGGIYWGFGVQGLLPALLFFLVTFSGRWPILGQALLRFDWLAALVLGVVALKRERHGAAGALLTYAMLVRVFPGIFGLPYVVLMVRDCLRERRLLPQYARFITGAVLCSVVLVGGSLAIYGADAYRDAAVNLKLHASAESFSSHRVGLGDALLYRGEFTRRDMAEHGEIQGKRDQLHALEPYLKLAALLAVVGIALSLWRSDEPHYRAIWLGVIPLFCMTNPQINYYNLRVLLVLRHAERWHEYPHQVSLYMLFAIEVLTQAMMVAGATRYGVTAMTSWGMLLYLALQIRMVVRQRRLVEAAR